MFHPLALSIGLRYTRAKRRNHFISFISGVSMLGITLGVAALITVISVMNGFEKELRERILGMVAHATIAGADREGLDDWQRVIGAARKTEHVIGAAPFIEREVMVQGTRVSGGAIRGVDPKLEASVTELPGKVIAGKWASLAPGAYNVILGQELAYAIGAEVGDNVQVFAPMTRTTPAGVLPVTRRFTVTGIFSVGHQDYDRYVAVLHMSDAQKLLRMGDSVTGVRLKLDDLFLAYRVASQLRDRLGGFYAVSDWTREQSNFFRAIQTEKAVMFIILSLIVGVAAFNLVSSLVMLVTDKQADIAILRTLGLPPRSVMGVFMVQGMLIGIIGIVSGVLLGVLLAENVSPLMHVIERTFGFQLLPAEIYYISDLPSDTRSEDVMRIVMVAFVMSLIATIYPAWRASRTPPAQALRYE